MSDIENIKDKIRAMLAKATDAGATAEEAASAMAMARKLMSKYALSEDQIATAKEEDFMEATWHYTKDSKGNVVVHPVDRYCAVIAGQFCGVKPYISANGDIACYGFASDVELFKWMMAAFRKHAEDDWLRFKRFDMASKRFKDIKEARKSFMHGFASGVTARLQDWIYRDAPEENKEASNALVLKKTNIVEARLRDMGLVFTPTKHRGSRGSDSMAAGAGYNSGQSANVGRGMGQSYIAIGAR